MDKVVASAAQAVADAGASAIELNLYTVPSDGRCSGAELEAEQLALVREVCQAVAVPVAVKLGPWYTSLAAMARDLEQAGAAGLGPSTNSWAASTAS